MAIIPRLNLTPEAKADFKEFYNIDASWLAWEYKRRFGRLLKVVQLKESCFACDHKCKLHEDHDSEVEVHIKMVSDASPGFTLEWEEKR